MRQTRGNINVNHDWKQERFPVQHKVDVLGKSLTPSKMKVKTAARYHHQDNML